MVQYVHKMWPMVVIFVCLCVGVYEACNELSIWENGIYKDCNLYFNAKADKCIAAYALLLSKTHQLSKYLKWFVHKVCHSTLALSVATPSFSKVHCKHAYGHLNVPNGHLMVSSFGCLQHACMWQWSNHSKIAYILYIMWLLLWLHLPNTMILHIHKHAITCYYGYSVLTVSI